MGSRKVRKNDAARREERAPVSEKARRTRTLRDLPDYTELHDERATNPVIRLTQRVTALPPPLPPEDSAPEQSLEALALLARRSSPPPRVAATQRILAPVAASSALPAAAAAARPSSIPAMTVGRSSIPPARADATTYPPRRRSTDRGGRGRGLGTVVLSATIGAIVALGMWSLRSTLDRAARTGDPTLPVAAAAVGTGVAADKCPSPSPQGVSSPASATGSPAANTSVLAASTAESEPRPVSIDTLPVAQSFGAATARTATTRAASRHSGAALAVNDSGAASSSERSASEPRPAVRRAPAAPISPRAAVSNAINRASFAARSCESGPQSGKVEVTFAPSGAVSSVNLIKGFDDVGVNGCVLRAFGRVRAAAFEGDPITVRKTVSW